MLYNQFCKKNNIHDLSDIKFLFFSIYKSKAVLLINSNQDLFYEDDNKIVSNLNNLCSMPDTVWINVN